MYGDAWTATYGSFVAQGRGRTVWLEERPARWGGHWGVGCCVCAHFERQRASTSSEQRASTPRATTTVPRRQSCGVRACTKFARYEVCHESMAASHVRDHALSEIHKLVVAAHLQPDKPVRILLQATVDDEHLLAGSVPQPADWLRAWRICMDPVSWATAAHQAGTEHYIAQIRERSVKPRAIQSMVRCMTEALRIRKRQWLESAKWIFLGFDDKNGRKLLRFKCDAEAESSNHTCFDAVKAENGSHTCFDAVRVAGDPSWLRYGARIGVVGCMPVGLEYGMDDYERDYAERTCEEIVDLITRLCTPHGETLDAQRLESVLAKVAGIVVDGALLKTARYMKASRFQNIVIIMRDPAHVIRTSCRDPLHDADVFSEQYSRLFDQRHAVLKDFMNSGTWQDQLQKCQEELLQAGASTPGLKSVLRHLAFVQPRFESFVSPRRRYVCLLRAIAMVLARKAGDERLGSAVQRRAEAALTAMSKSSDCFVAGLAGDYGEVCLEFLRKFDVTDHDPARTAREVDEFKRSLQTLFVQGYVLCNEKDDVPGLGTRRSLSQIAIENMEEPLVLTCSCCTIRYSRSRTSSCVVEQQ